MTTQKTLKKRIRARMQQTGERYTQARGRHRHQKVPMRALRGDAGLKARVGKSLPQAPGDREVVGGDQ